MSNRIDGPPVSLEASRRKVMGAIHAVERETKSFREKYLPQRNEEVDSYGYISSMCARVAKPNERIDDIRDVEPLLKRARNDADLGGREEFNEVRRMVERAKLFEYISFSLRNDLVDAYEKHLKKYCISFIQEARGEDLKSVRDYENRVIGWDEEVRAKLERMDNFLDQAESLKMPLRKYTSEYERVLRLMEESCLAMVAACEPMKRWCVSDANYPRRLQEEINHCTKRKNDLKDVTKDLQYQLDQVDLRLKRKRFNLLDTDKKLQEVTGERRYFQKRERNIRQLMAQNDDKITKDREDLNEVRARIKNRKENTNKIHTFLLGMANELRDNIEKNQQKNETLQSSLNNIKHSQDKTQKEIDRLNSELDDTRSAHDGALTSRDREEHDLKLIKEESQRLDSKIEALKRIREIKMNSDTVKRIYHHGYNPGQMQEKEDDLTRACKITSQDMGKDWSYLYQKLPFVPPRDFKERNQDIEVIDIGNRRLDDGFPMLTMKCLEKWRRLSAAASVHELCNTLKQMKKKRIVGRIQREVVGPRPDTVTVVRVGGD